MVSKNRGESIGYDIMVTHLHEDIIRHAGSNITKVNLSDAEAVKSYVEEHNEELMEAGTCYTKWLMDESVEYGRGLDFKNDLVWLARVKEEANNYSATEEVCNKRSGGIFELSLPEGDVLNMGIRGGVPGDVPLEFADVLYLENMNEEEGEEIWLEFVSSRYDVRIKRI